MGMCADVGLCVAMQAEVWLCRLVWMNVGSTMSVYVYVCLDGR